jgi:stage V sporulation protein SpoVS
MLDSAVGTVSLLMAAVPGETPTSPAPAGESPLPSESTGKQPTESRGKAHAGLRGSCQVSLEASSPRITAGETVTLLGHLVCTGGMSAADEPVAIYQRQSAAGASGLSEVGTATTEADNSYQFTPAAFNTNSVFVARFPTAHNARTVVKVAPLVTISGGPAASTQLFTGGHSRLTVAGTNRLTVTGTVGPAATGAHVALQGEYAATGEQWRILAIGRVGPEGHYSLAHSFKSPGEVSVRVVVHPNGANVAAASKPLSYVVSQTQNPQLTIQTSADPISSGQSVTITGVAAGAANQAVMLLARTRGHASFVAVAKATTDASGLYTFTASPQQSTFYRVLSVTTASTVLFEGVKYALTTGVFPSTVEAGKQLTFSGTLIPAYAGQAVYLERENPSGIDFDVVAVGTVDAASSYSIVHTFNDAATYIMRIRVPANLESQGSTSEPFTILVTPSSSPLGSEEPAGPISAEGQT